MVLRIGVNRHVTLIQMADDGFPDALLGHILLGNQKRHARALRLVILT